MIVMMSFMMGLCILNLLMYTESLYKERKIMHAMLYDVSAVVKKHSNKDIAEIVCVYTNRNKAIDSCVAMNDTNQDPDIYYDVVHNLCLA